MTPAEGSNAASALVPAGFPQRKLYLYLLPFALVPFVLFTMSFLVVPTRWFQERSNNSYLANVGYAAKLHGMQCEVLIYGDSSAMMGVDPAIVYAKTGLQTCNIAEFEAITLVDHTSLLDMFLRNNPRPKYLVFMYVPDDLTLKRDWSLISTFEAVSFNLQSNRNPTTIGLLFTHPKETFGWSELGLRMLAQRFHSKPYPLSVMNQRVNDRGLFRYTETVQTKCKEERNEAMPDVAWLASLRSSYGVEGTKVLIDATPTAPCDPSLAYYRKHVEPVIDNRPYPTIPISAFQDNGHLHANTVGINLISTMVADQVNAESNGAGQQGGR